MGKRYLAGVVLLVLMAALLIWGLPGPSEPVSYTHLTLPTIYSV